MRRVTGFLLAAAILTGCRGLGSSPGSGPASGPASSVPEVSSAAGATVVAQVATYQLVVDEPGRLLVAVVGSDNRWLSFGEIQFSFAYLGDASGSPPPAVPMADATAGFLPIPASPELDGPPRLTAPSDGHGVYAVEPITFPRAGYWQVTAHGQLAGGTAFSADAAFEVLQEPVVVLVGDEAPRSDNAVIGDAGVPNAALDSRASGERPIPDPELHAVSIADAIDAGHPALVVFSTPVYCVSQFCGPITDMVAELAADYADRADFIHVEIYRDFEAGELNQAVIDWLLTPGGDLREPWAFLIGADGRIAGSWDTLATRGEIEPLLEALPSLD